MNELLSICIPTYNRAEKLKELFENIIPQAEKHGLPIFVSDNASADKTREVVEEARRRYGNINYHRNEINLGAERNLELVLKRADTIYAWLLSDDDRLVPGAVDTVLGKISGREFNLVVVNGSVKMSDHKKTIRSMIREKVYVDADQLLAELGWHVNWMSCLIFSRKMVQEARFEKYFDTHLAQFGMIFGYLANNLRQVLWLDEPLVYVASFDQPAWFGDTFEIFGRSWVDMVEGLPKQYSEEAKCRCIMEQGERTKLFRLKFLIGLRLLGYYNLETYRRYRDYLPKITRVPMPILYLLAILPVPGFVKRMTARLIPILKRRHQ